MYDADHFHNNCLKILFTNQYADCSGMGYSILIQIRAVIYHTYKIIWFIYWIACIGAIATFMVIIV